MESELRRTWVTYISHASYIPGCLVLWSSMRANGTKYPLLVLLPVNPSTNECMISSEFQKLLLDASCKIKFVVYLYPGERLQHSIPKNSMDGRFKDTWTKFQAFSLFEYERVILLDADMLIRKNMDELFDLELPRGHIAACHACTCNPLHRVGYPSDWVPENCGHTQPYTEDSRSIIESWQPTKHSKRTHHLLNSGLVVLKPERTTFKTLVDFLATDQRVKTFRFPDQDLLAIVFKLKVIFLPYKYNALKTLSVIHRSKWSDSNIKNIHYILPQKPWHRFSEFKWVENSLRSPVSEILKSDDESLEDEEQEQVFFVKDPVSSFLALSPSIFYSLDLWWWQEYYRTKCDDTLNIGDSWDLVERCFDHTT